MEGPHGQYPMPEETKACVRCWFYGFGIGIVVMVAIGLWWNAPA